MGKGSFSGLKFKKIKLAKISFFSIMMGSGGVDYLMEKESCKNQMEIIMREHLKTDLNMASVGRNSPMEISTKANILMDFQKELANIIGKMEPIIKETLSRVSEMDMDFGK
jgi:hypothetical protein